MFKYKRIDNIYFITYKCPFTKEETQGSGEVFDEALDKLLDDLEEKMLKELAL